MAWVNLLDVIYPVGAIYMSINNTSPASIVGGTWTKLEHGVLACAGTDGFATVGSDGGNRYIATKHLPADMGSIYIRALNSSTDTVHYSSGIFSDGTPETWSDGAAHANIQGVTKDPGYHQEISLSGDGEMYLPYHTSVNVWKRTA